MKKKKWAVIVLMLCMVLLFPTAVSAAKKDPTITKIKWIHMLSEKFNGSEVTENIEIKDMDQKDEFYSDAVWAIGKGLVSLDKEGNLNPTETVSKGFSAYTLSLCLDIQPEDSTTEADVSAIPEEAEYYAYDVIAVSRGWFIPDGEAFDDSQPVTEEETSRMLADAETILSMQESVTDGNSTDSEGTYEFQKDVIEVPAEENVTISENEEDTEVKIQDSDTEIKEGDTFIVYQDSLPIAYEAQEVEHQGGDAVISASRADDAAYGEDINEQGTLQLNAANAEFTPADGVEVLTDTFALDSKVEYKNGKLVLGISKGESSINVTLSNMALKYSVTKEGTMMALAGNWAVTTEMVARDDIIDLFEKPIGQIRIYGVGVIKLQFRFGMSLSTKVSCSGTFTAGVSTLSDGTVRGIHEFTASDSSSIQIKGKIEFTLRISGGLDVLVMHGLVYGDIGMTTEASTTQHNVDDNNDGKTETITCDDIQEYFVLKVGYSVKVFKTSIASDSVSLLGDNKNQPVLFRIHFENGRLVSKCRFGMTVDVPDFGSKFTGGADVSEIDWSKRNLDVKVTLYEDLDVESSLTISSGGGIDLNGYVLRIRGDLIQETGVIDLNGGKLRVDGDYRIQKYNEKTQSYEESDGALRIEGENEEVIVGGDFYTQSTKQDYSSTSSGNNYFSAGTMTLKGNFTQLKGNATNFCGRGTKVIFAGEGTQEISFETPESSYFKYPVFKNTDIAVKSAISNWNLNEDIVIKDEGNPLEIVGPMNLNGNALTVERSVIMKAGTYDINGGNCKIKGDLIQESGLMKLNGGKLEVGGDYRIQKYDTKSKSYTESAGRLRMNGEKEEVAVGGDFYTQSTGICQSFEPNGGNYFGAGTLTLNGNFTQLKGNEKNFQADGIKVVFAGEGTQEISFETPESSYFKYPVFKNTDIAVKSAISNWNLNEDIVIKDEGNPLEIVGPMNLNGNALTVERSVIMKAGTYDINGGNCKIKGDLIQESGLMKLNGGKLEVGGDYRIQKYDTKSKSYTESAGRLRMNGEKEEVAVGGDFYTQSTGICQSFEPNGGNYFGAGTLTLNGNFTQLKGNEKNFQADGIKVVFAGEGTQEISFETPESSYFKYPVFKNTNIAVKSAISNWNLNEDITIKDEGYPLEIVGPMNLNGNNLTVERNMIIKSGAYDINKGSCKITGDLIQESGVTDLNGGKLEVGGDYRIQKYNTKSKKYEESDGALRIEGENEEVIVGGDFYTQSTKQDYLSTSSENNYFSAGTMTLKGNFTQLKGNATNFCGRGTKVIFAGEGTQEISFETPESSYFQYPVFKNRDVKFKSKMHGWTLDEDTILFNTPDKLCMITTMDCNGYSLTIHGDLIQEVGVMRLNGGRLIVDGDYRIQKYNEKTESYEESDGALRIEGENEEVIVGGDFYTQSTKQDYLSTSSENNYFSAGTMTLKGNFTQLKGNATNFCGRGTKVIFAGEGTQEISFETPESSYFKYPVFKNTNIAVKSAISNWNLNEDITIKDEGYPLEIVGPMNLNGNNLTVERNMIIKSGAYDINKGSCKITGDLIQESGVTDLNGGKLEVGGDYRIQKYNTKSKKYEESDGALRIEGENEEVIVGGDFYTQSTKQDYLSTSSENNYFSAGTMTLKGNFTQLKGNATNFCGRGTKIIFAGTEIQEVYFETPSTSYISNPVYQNTKVCYVGKRKIALSSNNTTLTVALPGNSDAASEGIIYSEDSEPTIDTQGRTRITFTENSNDEVTFDASGLEGNTFRAYVIIKDVGGTDRIFYSEPVKIAG